MDKSTSNKNQENNKESNKEVTEKTPQRKRVKKGCGCGNKNN